MENKLTIYEKFAYIQRHQFDIDKCIVDSWDKAKPKDGSIASWQCITHPDLKGTTMPLTDENINRAFGRRYWAQLSTEDNLVTVEFN